MAKGALAVLLFASFLAFSYGGPLTYEEFVDIRSECPRHNGASLVLIPHPRDCTEFFQCDNGRPVGVRCPQPLHFNPNLKVCDFKDRAGCKAYTDPEVVKSITGARGGLVRGRIAEPEQAVMKWDRRCSGTRSDVTTFLPHETMCNRYYVCNSNWAVYMACPQGLQFSMDRRICDYPKNVQCPQDIRARAPSGPAADYVTEDRDVPQEAVAKREPAENNEPVAKEGGESQDNVIPDYVFSDDSPAVRPPAVRPAMKTDSRCPRFNPITPIFIPHEKYCGKYYVCDWGYAILMSCPETLAFNPDTNSCSLPKDC